MKNAVNLNNKKKQKIHPKFISFVRDDIPCLYIIRYFSSVHKLHVLLYGEYGLALFAHNFPIDSVFKIFVL